MTRYIFGGESEQTVVTPDAGNGNALVVATPGTTVQLFDVPGGTLQSSFMAWNPSDGDYTTPISSITVNSTGTLGTAGRGFKGPDGLTTLYDAGGNALIARDAVAGGGLSEIPDDGVTTPKIDDGAVTTPKLADEAVTEPKVDDDLLAFLLNRGNHTGAIAVGDLPSSVPLLAVYSGSGTPVRPEPVTSGNRCFWICLTSTLPPFVTTGTGGRPASTVLNPGDICIVIG